MRWNARWRAWAAHHRVHVGIALALGYVGLSQPSPGRFLMGALIVAAGEAVRFWACGHLVRNERLTRTGPYRLVRHPLYLGSLLIGLGSALMTQVWWAWLAAFALLYGAFYLPAMYIEELRLQSLFGAEYREYMEEVPRLVPTWSRSAPQQGASLDHGPGFSRIIARRNRELRTVGVLLALLVVQGLKLWLGS